MSAETLLHRVLSPGARALAPHLARRRVAAVDGLDPAATQRELLRGLLRRARTTRFAADHGLGALARMPAARLIEAFQARVPLRDYEAFWEAYWRDSYPEHTNLTWPGQIPFFALTSGTTSGRSKAIPVSWEMVAANRRAALDVVCWHLLRHPDSTLFAGRTLMLGGSTSLPVASGAPARAGAPRAGDLSAIAAATASPWARPLLAPERSIALMEDWPTKLEALASTCRSQRITGLTGTTSWLLGLLDRVFDGPDAALPDLRLVVHGGVAWAPYASRFAHYFSERDVDLREVYPASEGFIAMADGDTGAALAGQSPPLRLCLDRGVFFEFAPIDETGHPSTPTRWVGNVEPDQDYALVISTCAGLWRYVLGDIVRLTDTQPPRLRITGRVAQMLSAFGEHVLARELDEAIGGGLAALGLGLADYCAGARLPAHAGSVGGHVFLVEPDRDIEPNERTRVAQRLAEHIDGALRAGNDDYAAHRAGDAGMAPPTVKLVPRHGFQAWLAQQGRLGGQHKVPRVVNDMVRFRQIERAVTQADTPGR